MDGAVVRPELVVEVTFDHTSNERIRHGTKLLRWRDDKDPRDCTMDQLDQLDRSALFLRRSWARANF